MTRGGLALTALAGLAMWVGLFLLGELIIGAIG